LHKASQQGVHLTLGILRQSQAVFYALSFFWLDGFAVPAPAQVTQTVGWLTPKSKNIRTISIISPKGVNEKNLYTNEILVADFLGSC
jgi:hypothetical protein